MLVRRLDSSTLLPRKLVMTQRGMHFHFHSVDTLPRLAWCAQVERGRDAVTVLHGPWVETGKNFFFEGAWNGDLSDGFADATVFLGSGGLTEGRAVRFATATHTYERLHLLRLGDRVLVSNSLAFVLARAGDSVDPDYPFYESDLMSYTRGLRLHARSIPTRGGNEVRLFYYTNLIVDDRLEVRAEPKRRRDPFRSYREYVDHLYGEVDRVHRNASSPARKVAFHPLTTISSGYDSPAVSMFARAVGCTEAITFRDARPGYEREDDSGREISALLGLKVMEFSRDDYLSREGFPEAEFLAAGTGGEEVVFSVLEDELPGKLLFTGYFGDSAWSRTLAFVTPDFRFRYAAGASFTEFRLRVGFINFAVPMVGFVHQPALHRISNSEEMKPWSTGTDYDRPIPRRLLQEAGIPGHLFGQTKMAISQPFYNNRDLARLMTGESYRDFQRFARGLRLFRTPLHRLGFASLHTLYRLNQRSAWRAERVSRRLGRGFRLPVLVPERYRNPRKENVFAFQWAMEKIQPRYVVAEPVPEKG